MKIINFFYSALLLSLLCGFNISVQSTVGEVITEFGCVGNCSCFGDGCKNKHLSQTLNAVGDTRLVQDSDIAHDAFAITVAQTELISIPMPEGKVYKRYVIRAAYKNNTPINCIGILEADEDQWVYKFFTESTRQPRKKGKEWMELGRLHVERPLNVIKCGITPDGFLVFNDQNDLIIMDLTSSEARRNIMPSLR